MELTDLQKLEGLYESVSYIKGKDLSPDEMIEAYEEFLEAYYNVLVTHSSIEGDEDIRTEEHFEKVKSEIDLRFGIPPQVLPDHGAHYRQLIADKVANLAHQADNNEGLSGNERSQLYAEASLLLIDSVAPLVFDMDQDMLERLSGNTFERLNERADFYYESAEPEELEDPSIGEATSNVPSDFSAETPMPTSSAAVMKAR